MNVRPKCPHCGYKFTDDDTFYGKNDIGLDDGDVGDVLCVSCGEEFFVRCNHTMTFECVVDEDELD